MVSIYAKFHFAGDLADACHHFGGLIAQLSHLSIALHLASTETAAYAIAYDNALRLLLQLLLTRRRSGDTEFDKLLCEENDDV